MSQIKGLMRTHNLGELRAEHIGNVVTLCGWVNKNRDLGGLTFIDLRDKFGVTQLNFTNFKGDADLLKKCHLESVIKVVGTVAGRPEEALNKNMATGEVEIHVTELEVLSECDINNIPFLPYGATEATEDNKLKYRYLDLRTKKLQDILKLRSKITLDVRNTMSANDFIEVETPILYKSTPEGARDYVVPSRVHPGHVYALPQSPQTLKQLLMIGGTDKYFQICKCFRDEDLRADRQPEFTQIDIEVSFATEEYMKNLATDLMRNIFELGADFEIPVMHYNDAMRDYGSDKPDVRFGLKQHIVSELFKDTEFGVFKSAIESGGMVKTMFVPASMGTFSRKILDGFVDVVKPHGGKGVAFFKVEEGKASGGISKFITDDVLASLSNLSDLDGDAANGTWLFFADQEGIVHDSADALRRHLGRELGLIKDGYAFLWVNDFPCFETDEERFYAKHHPFTSPKISEMDKFMNEEVNVNNKTLRDLPAQAYDLVCNGYELGGGSIRIHNGAVQERMFEVLGMSEEEVSSQFGFFVNALKYGTPPHGGIALGLDRITMVKAGTDNIRDVIAFPKTTTASDMMSNAPSVPAKEQTDELHFGFLK
ncbi:aspartate--tRNA ligase [Halobacteriovorax sp. HFRX-2_2]|uniref:aspartate--tRNA ligase n=1 Tax=unclassified Halobacteriovorax TaxID=2639665 RepID=UPI00371700D5